MNFDSTEFHARAPEERGLTSAEIGSLTRKMVDFQEVAAEIREWAELLDMEDLRLAAMEAEDRLMLAVHHQIPRERNEVLDELTSTWLQDRKRLEAESPGTTRQELR